MSFEIKFYNYVGENNKIDKGITGAALRTIDGTLVEDTSILTPSLLIEGSLTEYVKYNMMYIPTFKRWYFINDIVSIAGGFLRINAHVDVLYTYADQIKECYGIVSRSGKAGVYNQYLDDPEFKTYTDDLHEILKWPENDLSKTSKILILGGAT